MSKKIRTHLIIPLFLVPLVFSHNFYDGLITPKMLVFIAFLALAVALIRIKHIPVNSIVIAGSGGYFVLHTLLIRENIGINHYLLLSFSVFYALVYNQLEEDHSGITYTMFFTGLVLSLVGICQSLMGAGMDSLVGNSQFSGLTALCVFPLFFSFKQVPKWTLLLTPVFLVYVFVTQSLMLYIITVLLLVIFISLHVSDRTLKKLAVAGVLLLAIAVSVNLYIRGFDSKKFRFLVWKSTVQMIAENPLGIGLGRFSNAYHVYRTKEEFNMRGDNTAVENSHCEPLNLAAEGGILMLIPVFLFLAPILRKSRKISGKNLRFLLISGSIIMLSLAVSFPIRCLSTAIFLSPLLARVELTAGLKPFAFKHESRAIFSITVILLLVLSTSYFKGDFFLKKAIDSADIIKASYYFKEACKLRNDSQTYSMMGDFLRKTGQHKNALDAYAKAFSMDSLNPYLLENIGFTHYELGNVSRALLFYRKAAGIYPFSSRFQDNVSYLEKGTGKN